jgi:hypothetical protein
MMQKEIDYVRNGDGYRKFYDFQNPFELDKFIEKESTIFEGNTEFEKIFKLIRENEIGNNRVLLVFVKVDFLYIIKNYSQAFLVFKSFMRITQQAENH